MVHRSALATMMGIVGRQDILHTWLEPMIALLGEGTVTGMTVYVFPGSRRSEGQLIGLNTDDRAIASMDISHDMRFATFCAVDCGGQM